MFRGSPKGRDKAFDLCHDSPRVYTTKLVMAMHSVYDVEKQEFNPVNVFFFIPIK